MVGNLNKKSLAALALALSTSCQLHHSKLNMNPENPVIQEYRQDSVQNPVTQEGLDISHYHCDINWGQLTPDASGKQFIIVKATEGAAHQDLSFVDNWSNMANNGFQLGACHIIRVGTYPVMGFGDCTAKGQMKNLITQLKKADNDWADSKPIVLLNVMEALGTLESGFRSVGNLVEECVTLLKDEYHILPYIYTRQNFWNEHVKSTPEIVKECPLCINQWREREPSLEELPNGWDKWTMWHYSGQGTVPGISGKVYLHRMKK